MEASQEAACNRDVVMVRRGVHRETPRGPLVTLPVLRRGVSGLPLNQWILSIHMTRLWCLCSRGLQGLYPQRGNGGASAWGQDPRATSPLARPCPLGRKDLGNSQQKTVAWPVLDRDEGQHSRSGTFADIDADPYRAGTEISNFHGFNRCSADTQAFRELRHLHCVDLDELPYRKTYGFPISDYERVSPISYVHPRGAIGIVRYT